MGYTKGEWKQCLNPKCGGEYHINQDKVVDMPCRCLAKQKQRMMAFARRLK